MQHNHSRPFDHTRSIGFIFVQQSHIIYKMSTLGCIQADPEEILTTQHGIDLDHLNVIAWGYQCSDEVPLPVAHKYLNSEYVLSDGNHRALAQCLLFDAAFLRVQLLTERISHRLRCCHELAKVKVYPEIWQGQERIYLSNSNSYRLLDEIPDRFKRKIKRLLKERRISVETQRLVIVM